MARVTEAERKRIADELRSGKTPYRVAKDAGRSRTTVCKIAGDLGIELDVQRVKKASEARRDYAQAERLILLNEGFDKAREILANVGLADDLKDWAVAVGTLIDKRRLEDGEVTDRHERRTGGIDLEEEFRKLDTELAEEVAQEGSA